MPTSSDAAVTKIIGRGHGQVPGLSPSFWWCLFSRLAGCHLSSAWKERLGYTGAGNACLILCFFKHPWSCAGLINAAFRHAHGWCGAVVGCRALACSVPGMPDWGVCMGSVAVQTAPVPCIPLRDWLWEIGVYSKSFVVEKQISSWQTISGILFCGKRPFSATVQNLYLV